MIFSSGPMVAAYLLLNLISLLLLLIQSSICLLQNTNNDLINRLSKKELESLFGSHEEIPQYEAVRVSWEKIRRKRYSEYPEEEFHVVATITTSTTNFRLHLRQHNDIISPSYTITIRHSNFTEEIGADKIQFPECLYHGNVVEGGEGVAALSSCSSKGMTGIVIISGKHFLLQPLPLRFQNDGGGETHILHEKSSEQICAGQGMYRLEAPPPVQGFESEENTILDESPHQRSRRATPSAKTVELAIFVDDVLHDKIKEENPSDTIEAIQDLVFTMINAVQLLYNQPSLDRSFKFVIEKLEIFKKSQDEPSKAKGEIQDYLTNFCKWQGRRNPENSGSWDHGIMLSGLNLYQTTTDNHKVIGLAWVAGMCRRFYSCSINEGNTFESVFVIAHEMGHNLGMHHDGTNNSCNSRDFIMSPSLGPGKITWSSCSKKYLNTFLGNNLASCLKNSVTPESKYDHEANGKLPGQRYTAHQQCFRAFGSGYKPYFSSRSPFDNLCRELWCASGSHAKRAHPALDGTACARGKICKFGDCVTDDRSFSSSYDNQVDSG